METRNLRVWRDNTYPRYLQIIPSQVEVTAQEDLYGRQLEGAPGRVYTARRSVAGTIDMLTTPDQPIEVGHLFQTPVSIIRITAITSRRPSIGDYMASNVEWLRCSFEIHKRL